MAFTSFLTFQTIQDTNEALDNVIEAARASRAHLDVVVLGTLMSAPLTLHDVAPAAEWVNYNREVFDNAIARVEQIENYVAEKDISAAVTAECNYLANLEKIAARYALCTDIHACRAGALKSDSSIEKAFSATLFDARCPSLLLPDTVAGSEAVTKIAIAWNGKAEASCAVRNALPLLKNADRVNIVVVDPIEAHVGKDPGSDLAAYLSRYDINITVDVLASSGMSVSEKLLQRATDIDADLMVMGGYGHSKFREWLLGGTTRAMLENVKLPLFMAH